ncbi:MAG: hypothetical protein SV775_10030 [Thermodesulfobacteriota bacterium]|nr:hypothetical protein [Thermodesulfobacteriota bacterium]
MRHLALTLLGAVLVWMMPGKVSAYVMPADQLVGLMAANFSALKTLIITQTTYVVDPQSQEERTVLEERLWLKSPGFFRSEFTGRLEDQGMVWGKTQAGRSGNDMVFRRLLMANNEKAILALLSEMGIDLESVAFTRFHGSIAYRLGDKGPESPKLLIEKESHLPLLLSYRIPGDPGQGMTSVQFDDYRQLAKGWYPYRISLSVGKDIMERYSILDLQANIPIGYPLSLIPGEWDRRVRKLEDTMEEKRLEETIKLLREKYR